MNTYTPDRWALIVIKDVEGEKDELLYKVAASWYGGFADGDSWKINSGISRVKVDGDMISFDGYSGSTYECNKKAYGMSSYTNAIVNGYIDRAKGQIRLLTEEEAMAYVDGFKDT